MIAEARASFEISERLRSTLDMGPAAWADVLGMRELAYRKEVARPDSCLDERSLLAMAAYLELDPEAIVEERVDFAALSAHRNGFPMELPERYARGAFSKRRTSVSLLDFVEQRLGWRPRQKLLRQFQLNESIFSDPDGTISLRFLMDLSQALGGQGYALRAMGMQTVISNFKSPLAEAYREAGTSWGVYEKCFTELAPRFYDRNFKYRITRLTREECIVEVSSSQEASEELKSTRLGHEGICQVRMGSFACITGFLGLPYAQTEELRCVHRGDPACEVRIGFERATAVLATNSPIAPRAL